MTVGNLSTHLAKLEGAGYAELNKTFHGKRPVTHVRLSQTGWTAFEHYLENLNQLLGSLT
jgi:DNA-binding MarR family transcriptional regulator